MILRTQFEGAGTPFCTHRQYNLLLCAELKPPIGGIQTIVPMMSNLCPSKNNLLAPPLLGARSPWPLHFYLPSLSSTLPSHPYHLFPSPSFLLEVGSFNPSPSPSPISVVRGFSLPENLFKPRWMQVKIDTF